jgi:hypothetical protein
MKRAVDGSSGGQSGYHRLGRVVIIHVAVVICVAEEKVGHGDARKAGLAGTAEVESSAGNIGLGRIIVAGY